MDLEVRPPESQCSWLLQGNNKACSVYARRSRMLEPIAAKMMPRGIANTRKKLYSPFLLLANISALLLMGTERKSSSIGEMQFAILHRFCFFLKRDLC